MGRRVHQATICRRMQSIGAKHGRGKVLKMGRFPVLRLLRPSCVSRGGDELKTSMMAKFDTPQAPSHPERLSQGSEMKVFKFPL